MGPAARAAPLGAGPRQPDLDVFRGATPASSCSAHKRVTRSWENGARVRRCHVSPSGKSFPSDDREKKDATGVLEVSPHRQALSLQGNVDAVDAEDRTGGAEAAREAGPGAAGSPLGATWARAPS